MERVVLFRMLHPHIAMLLWSMIVFVIYEASIMLFANVFAGVFVTSFVAAVYGVINCQALLHQQRHHV